jgi:signal peptide peptidase SppA
MNIDHQIQLDALTLATYSSDVPHLADYFSIWSIYEPVFRAMAERYHGLDIAAHIRQSMASPRPSLSAGYQTTPDGIAQIEIRGVMMKSPSSLDGGTSSVQARMQIRAARRDPAVLGVMLVMDTPGGTVKGNSDLCADVADFAAAKPIYAFIEDMCASAGVSVASQATKRYANTDRAIYGSMGTYGVLVDSSAMAEKLGVKVHVVKAGEFKGVGEPGTAVTNAQLAEHQRLINAMNDDYVAMIAKGLRKSPAAIRELADGRVIFAADAVRAGLIDGVKNFQQAYSELVQQTKQRPSSTPPAAKQPSATLPTASPASNRSEPMPQQTIIRKPITITTADLAEEFSDDVGRAMAGGLSRQQAIKQVAARRPDLHQAFLDHSNQPAADPMNAEKRKEIVASWGRMVNAVMALRKCDRHKASAIAARENPVLHELFIRATNPNSAAF